MKFLLTCCFVWTMNTINAQEDFSALILVKDEKYFDLVDTLDSNKSFDFVILACPPGNEEQDELNKNSYTKNSLFVKEILQSPSTDLNTKICEKPYSPGIIIPDYEKTEKIIGYEFFLDEKQLEILSTILPPKNAESYEITSTNLIRTNQNWIIYIVLDTDKKLLGCPETTYLVSSNEYIGNFKSCPDFNLGRSYIKDKNIDKVYNKENQAIFLNKFLNKDQLKENYLIKQQLTPINDFDSYSKRLTTCTYLNVAPMWNTIYNGSWKNVEDTIREIAKFIPIEVTTGTLGQLKLPLLSSEKNRKFEDVVLYDTSIPKLYWKLVSRFVFARENQNASSEAVLIIMHNYFSEIDTIEPLCEESFCEKFNWKVENKDYKTGYTYCCKAESEVLNKLWIFEDLNYHDFIL